MLKLIVFSQLVIFSYFVAADDHMNVYPKVCKHGLFEQPQKNFSVFVFCDDALGTNIGIVLTRPGVGPIEGKPPYRWGTANRFWQSGPWCTDVTGVAWSKSGDYLYVATSPVYGDGGFFELNLITQESRRIFPDDIEKAPKDFEGSYYTRIESTDFNKGTIVMGLYELADTEGKVSEHEITTR